MSEPCPDCGKVHGYDPLPEPTAAMIAATLDEMKARLLAGELAGIVIHALALDNGVDNFHAWPGDDMPMVTLALAQADMLRAVAGESHETETEEIPVRDPNERTH